jgi:hypothetical protein
MTAKKTFSSSAWNVNRPNPEGCGGRNSALSYPKGYDRNPDFSGMLAGFSE